MMVTLGGGGRGGRVGRFTWRRGAGKGGKGEGKGLDCLLEVGGGRGGGFGLEGGGCG